MMGTIITVPGFIAGVAPAAGIIPVNSPRGLVRLVWLRAANITGVAQAITISIRPQGGGLGLAQWVCVLAEPIPVAGAITYATEHEPWFMPPNSSVDFQAANANAVVIQSAYESFDS